MATLNLPLSGNSNYPRGVTLGFDLPPVVKGILVFLSTCYLLWILISLILPFIRKANTVKAVTAAKPVVEPYVDSSGNEPTFEDFAIVLDVFGELLGRQPTSQELADFGVRIHTKSMSRADLEKHLTNTYEYKQKNNIENTNVGEAVTTSLVDSDTDRQYVLDSVSKILTKIPTNDEIDSYLTTYKTTYKRDKVKFVGYLRTEVDASGSGIRYDYRPEIRSAYIRSTGREPSETEFLKYSPMFKDGTMDSTKLYQVLTGTTPKTVASTTTTTNTNTTTSTPSSNTVTSADIVKVKSIFKSVFLKDPTNAETQFYSQKYVDNNRDETKTVDYMKQTPEYKGIFKSSLDILKKSNMLSGLIQNASKLYNPFSISYKTSTPTPSQPTAPVPVPAPVTTTPSQPTVNTDDNLTDVERVCLQYTKDGKFANIDDPEFMSKFASERNMDQLRMACGRENKMSRYSNATDNLVLIPGQEWSVPQVRQPICYQSTCSVNPQQEQTALIGTLLAESNNTSVGSILPSFTYTENVKYV